MAAPAPPPDRPTVLIVDDDRGIRALLSDILADLGWDAVAVEDGPSAVAALRTQAAPIRLAIIDLTLAGRMRGIETLRALREVRPGLAGIISTGADVALGDASREERFDTLAKPYKIDDLARAIERALELAK